MDTSSNFSDGDAETMTGKVIKHLIREKKITREVPLRIKFLFSFCSTLTFQGNCGSGEGGNSARQIISSNE